MVPPTANNLQNEALSKNWPNATAEELQPSVISFDTLSKKALTYDGGGG